jgi:hypothetical protein
MVFSSIMRFLAVLNTILSSMPTLTASFSDDLHNPFNIIEGVFIGWFTLGNPKTTTHLPVSRCSFN